MRKAQNSSLLSPEFFRLPTLEVAQRLLGMRLVSNFRGCRASGMIVEVEAYRFDDPASHTFGGKTERNRVMYEEGGHCYVYFIYGVHYCVNIVTESAEVGAAVLIRAIEPLEGLEVMRRRRKISRDKDLTNGPGKLCQALGITRTVNGEHFLNSTKIRVEPYRSFSRREIGVSPRIGITKAVKKPWRFYVKNNPWVSG